MTIQVFNCEQGTPEWRACRAGIPTASEYSTVMAKARDGKGPSVTRRKYMLRLIAERMTGDVEESYESGDMKRGKAMEPEARALYAFTKGVEVQQIGFIRNGETGCSPDGLINANGMVQIKTMKPELHIEALLAGVMPSEHKPQVQGELMVAEREWADFMSFWPKLPPLIVRVTRDEAYIRTLQAEVNVFNSELQELAQKISAHGG